MKLLFINILIAFAIQQIMANSVDSINSEDTIYKQEEQFMTEREYGSYLYNDPRGISCKVCHGEYGKGLHIATYSHRGITKEIKAPDITNIDEQKFKKALQQSNGVMPKYYLTDSEIKAIYYYISELK